MLACGSALPGCAAPERQASAVPPASEQPRSGLALSKGAELSPVPEARPTATTACAAPGCQLFDTPVAALAAVLEANPLVLGVGEAHALKGSEGVESTTSRFTEQLLPMLAPRSSDLIIELMEPDRRCLQTTEQVKKEQQAVTKEQASDNQNEFVTLGTRAKEAGVTPHILYPDCAQYERIVKAGDDGIFVMLETIATLTEAKAKAILARNQKAGAQRLVILYGGAVHNDRLPREGRGTWSYGPNLAEHTNQRYVELDLIVREYIKDTEVWQKLPWYADFDKHAHLDKVVLLQPSASAYVLIFPAGS
jgi:hypothetical protein